MATDLLPLKPNSLLLQATPKNLRLRKKILDETKRKHAEQSRVMKIVAE